MWVRTLAVKSSQSVVVVGAAFPKREHTLSSVPPAGLWDRGRLNRPLSHLPSPGPCGGRQPFSRLKPWNTAVVARPFPKDLGGPG